MADNGQAEQDAIVACMDLVDRCGAVFDIGLLNVEAETSGRAGGWWASATFTDREIVADGNTSATEAVTALSERLLTGADCRCGRTATLTADGGADRCRWVLVGRRWVEGCDAKPVRVRAARGDYTTMKAAMRQVREAASRDNVPRRGKWRRRHG